MFFDLVRRNSRRSRKENGLFFLSLLISIIAFYIILSLSQQDVMRFLKQMESDAVNRLLTIVPVFYCLTLLIVFFLVYYASKYQLERRRHEFGVYLMMGMSRKKLFFLLLSEDLRSSLAALAVGLPTAFFLSELTSLITARFVGIGILSHQISLSWEAVLWTAVGFVAVKLTAFVILSGKIAHQEIGDLSARAGGNQNAENACHLPFGSAVGRSAANRGVYSGDPGIFLAVGLPNGSDADFRSLRNISAFLRTADCDGFFCAACRKIGPASYIYFPSAGRKRDAPVRCAGGELSSNPRGAVLFQLRCGDVAQLRNFGRTRFGLYVSSE